MGVPIEIAAAANRWRVTVDRPGKPLIEATLVYWPRTDTKNKNGGGGKRPRVLLDSGHYLSVHPGDIKIIPRKDQNPDNRNPDRNPNATTH